MSKKKKGHVCIHTREHLFTAVVCKNKMIGNVLKEYQLSKKVKEHNYLVGRI